VPSTCAGQGLWWVVGGAGSALITTHGIVRGRCQGHPLTTGRVVPYASRQFTTKSPIRIGERPFQAPIGQKGRAPVKKQVGLGWLLFQRIAIGTRQPGRWGSAVGLRSRRWHGALGQTGR
jgi:hypothetical protein